MGEKFTDPDHVLPGNFCPAHGGEFRLPRTQMSAAAEGGDASGKVMVQPRWKPIPGHRLDLEAYRIALIAHDILIADAGSRIDEQRRPEIGGNAGPCIDLADRDHEQDDEIIDFDQQ